MRSRIKEISREGFSDRATARADAKEFRAMSGKVHEGGERADGSWGWTGAIRVDDTNTRVTGDFGCGRCAGTGQYITMVENGKPKGPGGICFRCQGKTFHTLSDRMRNVKHDEHAILRALRADMAA